ncbi:MAG: xanthine dehydrogenase family protein molybdopterin-binding subunit [Bryobacteraceae bacterium]|nr:xanthine dehydrogenase family protein molybdopterin-binding subunit [Bryobacteraceae bacterium]
MKIPYGISFPAPENQTPESSLPIAAAVTLAAPKTVSAIARLTSEAYARLRQENVSVELLPVDRRAFLGTVFSAGALVLGAAVATEEASAAANGTWQPAVYLGFEPDGQIVITAHRSEMGTGSRTSLPLVLADELDVDWKSIRVEQAIGDDKYGSQNTDGSCSVRDFVQAMHQAGATARLMLERSAAQKWDVPASEVSLRMGKVVHAKSGRTARPGDLVAVAATLPLPAKSELRFKTPDEYRYIGKNVPMLDQHDIVSGKAVFGMDATRPGMLFASVERPPVYASKVKTFDDADALKVKGVQKTIQLPPFKQPHVFQQLGGVAVIADSTWAAMQGRKKLKVEWEDNPSHASFASEPYKKELFASVHQAGKVVRARGDFDNAFSGAAKKHEADYYVPMLAHASMEPPVAVAEWQNGKVETWCPTQNPQAVQEAVAAALGITPKDVTCHVTLLGGGFGRKSKPDYVVEAALLSKAAGKPVKVVWSREEDIRFDYYHSVAAMHMKGGLDESGNIQSWLFRSAFPPIASTFSPGAEYGADFETGMALNELLFDVPNIRAENCPAKHHVRHGWLRAVCHLFHAFAVHSFVDELAHLNGTNYVDYYLKTLGPDRQVDLTKDGVKPWNNGQSTETFPLDTGRLRRVLEQCAQKSGYAKFRNTKTRAIGIAAHRSFLSYVATAVEVAIDASGNLTIPNVWTVADVGQVVMPDRVRSQFEGAAVFGTSLAMMGEITADAGRIVQSNFHNYPLARMKQSPRNIDVTIVDSKAPHAGVGEPGAPVIAPALTAAIFNATGKRIRELPVKRTKLV